MFKYFLFINHFILQYPKFLILCTSSVLCEPTITPLSDPGLICDEDTCPPLSDLLMSRCLSRVSAVSQVDCCLSGDGVVSEGPAVGAGGGADHIWTASAAPGADEGGEEDLQVGPD